MIAARLPLLAHLFQVTETETPYGGRSSTYDLIGSVWLRPGTPRRRTQNEAGRAALIETLTAESRSDARLAKGRVLQFGGGDWRIVAAELVGGRARLNLERVR